MICSECNEFKPLERNGKCGSCNHAARKAVRVRPSDNNTPINKMSDKTATVTRKYMSRLKTWKRGKKCAATFPHDCSDQITCHHMMGRGNHFHDEWAEENQVELTRDERFWLPVCINAHDYITEHSKFAWENGYSYKRVSDKIFQKQ